MSVERESAYALRTPVRPHHLLGVALLALAGTLGCSAPELGDEPELVAVTTGEIQDLEITNSALYWAAGHVEKVALSGGEVMDLGGEEVCAIETDGQWIYRADGSEIVFTSIEGGMPSVLTSKEFTSGRDPLCSGLALAGDDVFALMGYHSTMLVNAPIGVAGTAQMKLGGVARFMVADEDAVYYELDGQLLKQDKLAMEPEVLVEDWSGGRQLKAGQDHLYWQLIESDDGRSSFSIRSVPKDGGEVKIVTEVEGGCGFYSNFTIDDEYAYFGFNMDRDGSHEACHGDDVVAIAKAPLSGGDPSIITAQATIEFPEHFVTNDSHVFFTECFSINGGCQIFSVAK